MYDPIVLEDLVEWMHRECNMSETGVGVEEVKQWCLVKGVCCVGRENRVGVSRKKF